MKFTMYDVAIIGGGPAGASAGIFTAKAGKKTLVLDEEDGMTQYAWVKNHYGVVDIDGPEMLDVGKEQLGNFGAEIVKTEVTDIVKQVNGFKLVTGNGEFEAKVVIFATGENIKLAEKIGVETKPATEPELNKIIAANSEGKTNIEGIWAAGAIAGVSPHTIITAGDGAKVAVNVISEMNGKRYLDHDAFSG
jgi:thioredoxin reductase (NADPH)